ncbi:MAG: PD40 domain-containing protein [Bacteroidetes bacterium]|nr:PD40 domain-containing protein [Bacteroidota bacterium]
MEIPAAGISVENMIESHRGNNKKKFVNILSANKKFIWCASIVLLNTLGSFAQSPADKMLISHADQLFSQREYEQAYSYYTILKDAHKDVIVYQYRAGVCAIYTGDAETALTLLKSAYDKDPTIPNVNFFLGRAYLLNDQYDDASLQFNLQIAKEKDPDLKARLQQYIVNCSAAKELNGKPTNNHVTNCGAPLNTSYDEYAPVYLDNDSTLIYTYKGPGCTGGKHLYFESNDSAGYYFEDIVQSTVSHGSWYAPQGLNENINTASHDAATAVSPDGTTLFIFRSSSDDGGDIYWSKRNGREWSDPQKLKGDVNSGGYWEGSVSISADGHTIYFASDRPGGFGGKDIYKAELMGDSVWTNVQNLGANVNTAFDDDAPYILPDGSMLYYASRGHNSMGGYDIFFSTLGGDMLSWELAQNMGAPVNSTADDIFYQPTKDGYHAVFASNRKGGMGMMDLYFADPGVPAKDQLTIQGLVTLDGKPVGAMVTVTYVDKQDIQGDYSASTLNGRYSINLPSGENYKLFFQVSEQEEYSKTFDATQIQTYTTHVMDVEFFSDTALMHKIKKGSEMVGDKKDIVMRNDSIANYLGEDGNPVEPGYYVVVGSFKNADYARRMKNKLIASHAYPKIMLIFNKNNGFTYCVIAHPGDQSASEKLVLDARKAYPDAWIEFLK